MNANDLSSKYRTSMMSRVSSWPVLTLIVAAIAILLGLDSHATAHMSFDREAITSGEIWRWVTGHLTHWNTDHLVWDVLMFVVLSCMVERRRRQSLAWLLILSSLLISWSFWHLSPGMRHYRGLSGIDSALFAYVVVLLARDALKEKRYRWAMLMVLLLLGFVGKVSFELATGTTLFVDSHSAGFTPLPTVHIVGAAIGLLLAATNMRHAGESALPVFRRQASAPLSFRPPNHSRRSKANAA